MKRHTLLTIILLTAVTIFLAACGGNDETAPPAVEATQLPVVDQSGQQPQVLPTAPADTSQPEPQVLPTAPADDASKPQEQPTAPADTSQPEPQVQPTAPPPPSTNTTHTIQQREWLAQIARCYGTSPADIANANSIPYPGVIMPGTVWTIPNVGSVGTAVGAPCTMNVTVQQGDTLFAIATTYKIPLTMLVFANYGCYSYNPFYDWHDGVFGGCTYTAYPTIYPGDNLVVPVTVDNVGLRP
jgi:LysM repeat protein